MLQAERGSYRVGKGRTCILGLRPTSPMTTTATEGRVMAKREEGCWGLWTIPPTSSPISSVYHARTEQCTPLKRTLECNHHFKTDDWECLTLQFDANDDSTHFGPQFSQEPSMSETAPIGEHPVVIRFIEDTDSEAEAAKYFQNRLIQLLSQGMIAM